MLGPSRTRALTVIELIAVIAILGIIAALIIPLSKSAARAATKAGCLTNMRSLHTSLSAYMEEVGHWPQLPYENNFNDEQYENYWIRIMKPYTGTDKVWLCPALSRAGLADSSGRILKMHYVPTEFDATPISPKRWPTQPWLIEQANVHGGGALILFPDGSIKAMNDLLIKRK